jgi:hypothetical protein
MRQRRPGPQTVWGVFFGEENDEGVVKDSVVRAVYDSKEAASIT